MAYSQTWLENNNNRRCLLVEVTINQIGSGTTTLYFSTSGYITTTSDVFYQPIIEGGLTFTESLALGDTLSITYGDVELNNKNGELDAYLDYTQYIWANGTIKVYFGDPTWVCTNLTQIHTDFRLIFNGVITNIDTRARDKVNIKLRDKLQQLNTAISATKLGTYGTWGGSAQTNVDTLIPIVFGEVFNMSPLLIDPSTLEYYVNLGNTERIIEVRDNGVPVAYTFTSTTGKFKLTYPAIGQITASVQGVKDSVSFTSSSATLNSGTYNNNIASIIALIATQYGNSNNRLALTDIDYVNFNSYYNSNTQAVGVLIQGGENALDICNQLVGSISGQLFCTKEGLLQILTVGKALTTVSSVDITTSDIINPTLSISSRSTVAAATKLGYTKNWTVEGGLVTAIPQEHKDNYALEWYSYTKIDNTTKTNYKLNTDPIQKDTLLIVAADANTEAQRLNTFYKTVHTVYSFTGTAKLMSLKLGQPIMLYHPRFGLSSGISCQVISLSPSWTKGTIDVGVMVL